MIMEVKELLEAIGFSGDDATPEKVVEHINKSFIARKDALNDPELSKHYSGAVFGKQNTLLSKLSGGKYTKEALQEMGWEKAFETVVGGLQSEVEAVKSKSKEGEAKQLTELRAKLEDYEKSIQDYERDKKTLAEKLQEVEGSAAQQIKEFKLSSKKKDVLSSLPWKDGLTDLERAGFETYLNTNYVIDLNEKDEILVKDKEGHTIPHPKKAGEVLSFSDVVGEIGEKYSLFKRNNGAPEPPKPRPQQEPQKTSNMRSLPAVGLAR